MDIRRSPSLLKFSIPVVFFLSLLVSCAGPRPLQLSIKPTRSPDEILRNIEMREREIEDLKGIARIRVTNADRNHSLKEVIIVRRPSSLRMETLGFFGQPLFFLTVKEGRLSILSLMEKRFYQGAVTPENLSIIFPFHLGSEDLCSILLGGIPVIEYLSMDMEFVREENLYILKLMKEGGGPTQFLWVEPSDLSIMKTEIYDYSENFVLGVIFDDYKRINGRVFPMSACILLPSSSTKIRINYSELEINTGVTEDVFDLDVPPGVKIVNLD